MQSTGWRRKVHIGEVAGVGQILEVVQAVDGCQASTRRMRVSMTSASSRKLGEDTEKQKSWIAASTGRARGELTPAQRRLALVETVNPGTAAGPVSVTSAENLEPRLSWTYRARHFWVEDTRGHRVLEGMEALCRRLHCSQTRSMLPRARCRLHRRQEPAFELPPDAPANTRSYTFALVSPADFPTRAVVANRCYGLDNGCNRSPANPVYVFLPIMSLQTPGRHQQFMIPRQ